MVSQLFSKLCYRKDQDKLEKINAFREAIKRVRIGADQMPTVCFYSIANAHQGYVSFSAVEC